MRTVKYIMSLDFEDSGLMRVPVTRDYYADIPLEFQWVGSPYNISIYAQFFGELLGGHKIHCLGDGGLAFETRLDTLEPVTLFCRFVRSKSGRQYGIGLDYAIEPSYNLIPFFSNLSMRGNKKDVRQLFLDALDFFTFHFDNRNPQELSNWSEMLTKLDYALSKVK